MLVNDRAGFKLWSARLQLLEAHPFSNAISIVAPFRIQSEDHPELFFWSFQVEPQHIHRVPA